MLSLKKIMVILFIVDSIVLGIFFFRSGFLAERSDTRYFVAQINGFRGIEEVSGSTGTVHDMVYFRGFKPFYGVAGLVFPGLQPRSLILFLNIVFLFGLTVTSFYLFRFIGYGDIFAIWGAVWIVASYPMLKYGLALMTDISGWFFAVLTIVVCLYGIRKNNIALIGLASLVGFVGSLSKETAVMGIAFSGIYILITYADRGWKNIIRYASFITLPFVAFQVAFMIWMHKLGQPSFISWYQYNVAIYFHDFYKIRYFLTNEFLSLNAIYIFSVIGLIYFIRNGRYMHDNRLAIYTSGIVPSLLVLLWPVFYYRVMFIQLLFFIPIALDGLSIISEKRWRVAGLPLENCLAIIPPVTSIVLFFTISKL